MSARNLSIAFGMSTELFTSEDKFIAIVIANNGDQFTLNDSDKSRISYTTGYDVGVVEHAILRLLEHKVITALYGIPMRDGQMLYEFTGMTP